ncbi:hypothetical protein [Desulfonatronum thioautotrophicum]|uniref:hypothetical protein n=1 Tax=Desulfonatronum thioautotrophicum TaxID=617001 RepID=UPI0005EB13FF|nr:hypothetical protein [Desulfonatronum thioautotrophicum]
MIRLNNTVIPDDETDTLIPGHAQSDETGKTTEPDAESGSTDVLQGIIAILDSLDEWQKDRERKGS